jgi:hypothetical protein
METGTEMMIPSWSAMVNGDGQGTKEECSGSGLEVRNDRKDGTDWSCDRGSDGKEKAHWTYDGRRRKSIESGNENENGSMARMLTNGKAMNEGSVPNRNWSAGTLWCIVIF